ncbi:uncharacterized protein LOC112689205 isoform X2 [Sipha flava]|uniref:Uncharacterized protein LOC112689205 isoform X2 n=1 Tax=Sipha flava TaxID=143950 RepID=A0A8B8G5R0_9HEMI|nr:uncharacterized protein LOC112689205 isoform X2 [Sipha flava]
MLSEKKISNKMIWVSIDETTDIDGRFIANVNVGTLEEHRSGGIHHDNVLLFLSDAAPYMVKAGEVLKSFYSKMIHVTCAVHGLHRVAEEVRGQFSTVDKIISCVKIIFRKAPSRLLLFKTEAPNIRLPPEPINSHPLGKLD